jgi:hypothetical protein
MQNPTHCVKREPGKTEQRSPQLSGKSAPGCVFLTRAAQRARQRTLSLLLRNTAYSVRPLPNSLEFLTPTRSPSRRAMKEKRPARAGSASSKARLISRIRDLLQLYLYAPQSRRSTILPVCPSIYQKNNEAEAVCKTKNTLCNAATRGWMHDAFPAGESENLSPPLLLRHYTSAGVVANQSSPRPIHRFYPHVQPHSGYRGSPLRSTERLNVSEVHL